MATGNQWVVSMPSGQALPVCRPSSSFGFLLQRAPQVLSLSLVGSPSARFISPRSRTTPLNALAIHAQDPDFYQIPYVDGKPVGKRLKLWNLPPNCKHSELLEWFAGADVKVELLEFTDDPVLNAQGVGGFVEFVTKQDACIAIVRLDGYKFRGHYIRMDFAEKRTYSQDYGSRRPYRSTGSSSSSSGGSFSTSSRLPVTDMVPSHSGTTSGNAQPTPGYEATNSSAAGVSSGYGSSTQSSSSPRDGASISNAVQQQIPSASHSSHSSHASSDRAPKYNGAEPNGQSYTVPSANSVSPPIPQSSPDYGNANSQSGLSYGNTSMQSSTTSTSTQSSLGRSQGPSSHASSDRAPKYNGSEPNGQSYTVPSANSVTPSIPQSSPDYGNANSQSGLSYGNTGMQSSTTSTSTQSSLGRSQGPSDSSCTKSSSGSWSSQQRPSYGRARQAASSSSRQGSSSNNNRRKQSFTGSFTMDDVASFATPAAPGRGRTNFPMSSIVEEYDEIFKNYGAQDEAVVVPWSKNVNFRSGPMFGSPQPSSLNRLFVGNLAVSMDDASLQELFSKFGTVLEARVLRDQESGRSRGFAVVAMSSVDEMKAASNALDGWLVESRPLKVEAVTSSH